MSTQTQGYIMLSYAWRNKDIVRVVRKIRDRLKEEGYKVWIDIEQMKGFIYGTMANAVKEADLVLACLSKDYEESENCKSECGCIREFKTRYIPLLMEDYKLNDWVAGIFSGQTRVNFSNEDEFDEKFQELLRLLQDYPSLNPQGPNPDLPPTANPELSEEDFGKLLFYVSSWWQNDGNVNMLKVLLCDFPGTITRFDIQQKNTAFDLFQLVLGRKLISLSDIDVLIEATNLGGLRDIELTFEEKLETFQGFGKVKTPRFTDYRRKLIKFGNVMSGENKVKIGQLNGLRIDEGTDQWVLIFQLESKSKLTETKKQSFIKQLKANRMYHEAKALE